MSSSLGLARCWWNEYLIDANSLISLLVAGYADSALLEPLPQSVIQLRLQVGEVLRVGGALGHVYARDPGTPCSFSRSTTPAPTPIESTRTQAGAYRLTSAFTRPAVSMVFFFVKDAISITCHPAARI